VRSPRRDQNPGSNGSAKACLPQDKFYTADKRSEYFNVKSILLRTEEAVNLCNTPQKTWRMWNKLGKVPQPLKIGKLHFWRYDELVSWIDAGCPVCKLWKFQSETKQPKTKP
jgi:predicted DNA-binding transcriptional regulator AlpA